jgi:hypothetical protein
MNNGEIIYIKIAYDKIEKDVNIWISSFLAVQIK